MLLLLLLLKVHLFAVVLGVDISVVVGVNIYGCGSFSFC